MIGWPPPSRVLRIRIRTLETPGRVFQRWTRGGGTLPQPRPHIQITVKDCSWTSRAD